MTLNDKFLSEKEILKLLPVSRSAWLNGVSNGEFPAPIFFGKLKFWHEKDISELLQRGTK